MSEIRLFDEGDLPAVAGLFQRRLRKQKAPASPSLQAYLKTIFLDRREADDPIASKVHVRADGRVSGFLGVLPMPMEFNGEPLRAAVCGTFMVDGHDDDPFAGARLLRDVLSGPQDLSFSETSNDISTGMWRKMRAIAPPSYCLEWLRVLRPAAFGLEMAAGRLGALRVLRPLAISVDALSGRRGEGQSWSRYRPTADKADGFSDTDASEAEFIALVPELLAPFELRPRWSSVQLEEMLVHSRRKALHGERVLRIVRARTGKAVGAFLYYGDRGRVGRVVQIMALPGLEGIVIDRLLKNAYERDMAALRGRVQPALLDAMLGRKFAFVHASSTVLHSRRPELLKTVAAGHGFFNGLAGEGWTRLIGDRFD
ncbi:hypothetical protein [Rhizobium sp. Root482]|uniref:hypothetical protein n=1 Tax=Rhizobium sp. Root482 TaxID=1736543 RepID=UPI0006FE5C7D|nr:hypothetical protein [Rhizobium sp. Root482]KQY13914.1 hypothetical protein ASD31_12125 [Rhizobium sp. Root482]